MFTVSSGNKNIAVNNEENISVEINRSASELIIRYSDAEFKLPADIDPILCTIYLSFDTPAHVLRTIDQSMECLGYGKNALAFKLQE